MTIRIFLNKHLEADSAGWPTLALILRVFRGSAPGEFALQFPQPAEFTTEPLDHEADHPPGFMKPVAHFFLDRS